LHFSRKPVFQIRFGLDADLGPAIYLCADPGFAITREAKISRFFPFFKFQTLLSY
jgi:hypothetical protein